jgi:hypothetical protein
MARRLRLEDKYLAIRIAVQQGIAPRRLWQEIVKSAMDRDRVASPESVREAVLFPAATSSGTEPD